MIGILKKENNIWVVNCVSNVGSRFECYYQSDFKPENDNQFVNYRIKSKHHGIILCADVVTYLTKEYVRDYKLNKICS